MPRAWSIETNSTNAKRKSLWMAVDMITAQVARSPYAAKKLVRCVAVTQLSNPPMCNFRHGACAVRG